MDNSIGYVQSAPGEAAAGAAIYSRTALRGYDWYVHGFSNRFVWKCPTALMVDWYNTHVSANHLDVGVGTGYFLDKCRFPSDQPRIMLMDLNANSLQVTANRLRRYSPTTHQANVMESVTFSGETFDSIGLNYLIHCLPGNIKRKSIVFKHMKPLLNKGGMVFGTTILGQGVPHNPLARRLLKVYNQRGIFSNGADSLADLDDALRTNFDDVTTCVVGTVAFFSAHD